jgi:hypothetical protein
MMTGVIIVGLAGAAVRADGMMKMVLLPVGAARLTLWSSTSTPVMTSYAGMLTGRCLQTFRKQLQGKRLTSGMTLQLIVPGTVLFSSATMLTSHDVIRNM